MHMQLNNILRSMKDGIKHLLKRWHLYEPVRSLLYLSGFRRSGRLKTVSIERLLCGGEKGLTAAQYSRHTGNFLRPSTPFARSPYVQFLEQYLQIDDEIFSPEIFRKTSYFVNAAECINAVGSFYDCTREDDVERIARHFTGHFKNPGTPGHASAAESPLPLWDSPLCVRPIRYSDCYELVEGAHGAAAAYVRGEKTCPAIVAPEPAITPLQQLLLDHAFTCDGRPRLYQPVDSPEVKKWQLIRRCNDRFEMISRFLLDHDLMPPKYGRYLDIACNYGWFVKAFEGLGFSVRGVEMDWAAVELGKSVYGLKPDQIIRSEAVHFLRDDSRGYDITSCFSLLHHFILGRAAVSGEEMLGLIDRVTRTVFFFDMGQCHEEWFRKSLAGWDEERIEQWILRNSSFTKIYRIGKDCDSVEPYKKNYGRTLFACLRQDI
jgi:hypothetical protein